ncbi:MAG TPA: exonuclease SbcCD subunit D [Saprospiraceae bacterium]|nr:exonuclease SbcCD subunit D [Saprospiraceae bacterium]HQP76148.1 exonuclease SbcCD subunit D [Saprospiraceae bacterium]
MKILHTADWHLGKKLDSFSRIDEQMEVLAEICEIADTEGPDMVIVAGDLFDAFNPSTEAIELLYRTLKRLTANGTRPVIAISGNHDSPALIDAPEPLARECGIIMAGYPDAEIKTLELPGFSIIKSAPGFIELKIGHLNHPVRVILTPYANEVRMKEYFGDEKDKMLNQSLHDRWHNLADHYCDDTGVNILTAHLYMMNRQGAILEEPEGEKPIRIGNADLVYSESIPSLIQYTALGHLHGFRNVGTEDRPAIYSSSPLPYSFSEAGQDKYVVIIDVEPGKNALVRKSVLQKGRRLYRKTFDDIDLAVQWLDNHPNALIELTIESDSYITASDRKRLHQAHDGIIHLIPKIRNNDVEGVETSEINISQDIRQLFSDYFKTKNAGQEPNEEIMNLFNEILQQ